MNIVIIEDELPTRRMLENLVDEIDPSHKVVSALGSIEESINWFNANPHPEIVLMDIQLSDGISFDILKNVRLKSMVIFITAYDEYAIQAFKVNSIDYLLKPVSLNDLKAAFLKYDSYSRNFLNQKNQSTNFDDIVAAIKKSEKHYRNRFLIQSSESFIKLGTEEIAFFYSTNKISFAVTFERREYPVDLSLDKLEDQLNPDKFFRANRQVIVNIDSIRKIHPYFLGKLVIETNPKHGEQITVSKDKAARFKRWLDS